MTHRLTLKAMTAAIEKSGGVISLAAERLGVSRATLYRRVQKSDRLQEVQETASMAFVELAESAIFKALEHGDLATAKFVLRHRGQGRGWNSNRHDFNVSVSPFKEVPPFSEWYLDDGIEPDPVALAGAGIVYTGPAGNGSKNPAD